LALIVGMEGAVAAPAPAACAFNNAPGGADNTTAQNCISYNNGATTTGNIINEATGSLNGGSPYPPLNPGTSTGISVVKAGTKLIGDITNNGSISAPQYGINLGPGRPARFRQMSTSGLR